MSRAIQFFLCVYFPLLLAACSLNPQNEMGTEPGGSPTAVVVRILDLDAVNLPSSATPSSIPSVPSSTPMFASTATIPPEVSTLNQPSAAPSPICSNRAEFIKHLTISDNTALDAGQAFGKIWRVKNTGSCTWGTDYSLLFLDGDKMEGPYETPLPLSVAPGETIDLRIQLMAPEKASAYTGKWVLSEPGGGIFGIGEDGQQPLEVTILVKPPPPATPG